jgi:transcriptional antiterminator RfaH
MNISLSDQAALTGPSGCHHEQAKKTRIDTYMPDSKPAWFCLRSQPKHEHIAAAHLRQRTDTEVFVPRIRFKRMKRQTVVWVTEALFPNYLFARFDWHSSLRQIYYSPGICDVVHFGTHWPVIADEIIDDLRASLGNTEIQIIPSEVAPGDPVKIVGGSFHGLQAVVSSVQPSAKRVAVLMEFLGRQTAVEVDLAMVIKQSDEREVIRPAVRSKI